MLGLALLGTAAGAVYRRQLDRHLPAGITAEAAGTARQSVADGAASAQRLGSAGNALLTEVYRAFTAGLTVACGIGLVVFAVLAGVLFRAVGRDRAAGRAPLTSAAADVGQRDARPSTMKQPARRPTLPGGRSVRDGLVIEIREIVYSAGAQE